MCVNDKIWNSTAYDLYHNRQHSISLFSTSIFSVCAIKKRSLLICLWLIVCQICSFAGKQSNDGIQQIKLLASLEDGHVANDNGDFQSGVEGECRCPHNYYDIVLKHDDRTSSGGWEKALRYGEWLLVPVIRLSRLNVTLPPCHLGHTLLSNSVSSSAAASNAAHQLSIGPGQSSSAVVLHIQGHQNTLPTGVA